MTHTSYEISKRLKEFMGVRAPEPMNKQVWKYNGEGFEKNLIKTWAADETDIVYPAYQLHDLLSKPLCEAMAKKVFPHGEVYLAAKIFAGYYNGGLPAVEKALMEMMEGK